MLVIVIHFFQISESYSLVGNSEKALLKSVTYTVVPMIIVINFIILNQTCSVFAYIVLFPVFYILSLHYLTFLCEHFVTLDYWIWLILLDRKSLRMGSVILFWHPNNNFLQVHCTLGKYKFATFFIL